MSNTLIDEYLQRRYSPPIPKGKGRLGNVCLASLLGVVGLVLYANARAEKPTEVPSVVREAPSPKGYGLIATVNKTVVFDGYVVKTDRR